MIRRKLVGNNYERPERSSRIPARNKILLTRNEKRALRSLRLMEKVESIGLENIMHASSNYQVGISPLAVGSVRTRTASPMTQLTSLKNISQQQRRDDPYAMNKETIKAVLNKGISQESLLSDITTDGSTTSSITNSSDPLSDSTLNSKKRSLSHLDKATATPIESIKTLQKIKPMQRQKSRRSLINGGGGQRPDLGTVAPAIAKSLSNKNSTKNSHSTKQTQELDLDDDDDERSSVALQQTYTQSFVGSISSLFFGRKGGLL